jgi:predicted permease
MPESFHFLRAEPELILPQRFGRNLAQMSVDYLYFGLARLKPGITLAQANEDLARMLPMLDQKAMEALRLGPALRPLKEQVVGDIGNVLWVLMATVGMVLLIACANVANLLLVRAVGRERELSIRAALGAGWSRIVRELLAETAILAVLGGTLGLLLARGGLALLVKMRPANLPRLMEMSIDPLVLAFLIGTSLFSALLFGLIPTIKHARPRIAAVLGGSRTATQSRERHRSQNTLVVVQMALALVLLVGAGLMIRSLLALLNIQPGFTRPEEIQLLRISIPPTEPTERVTRIQNDILDKIAALPGVASAAFATTVPLDEGQSRNAVAAENKDPVDGLPPIRVAKSVSPGVFKTQGTPLIAGRDFTWSDIYEMRPVAIVSESMAREVWGNAPEALGKRIRLGNIGEWREIVGGGKRLRRGCSAKSLDHRVLACWSIARDSRSACSGAAFGCLCHTQ